MRTRSTTFQNNAGKPPTGTLENLRLTWRLLRDPKVAPLAKVVVPILALVYLVSPIDLIPDVILGLGQIDDIGVTAFLAYVLVSIVKRMGWSTLYEANPRTSSRKARPRDDNVIDATYRVVSDQRASKNHLSTE